MLEGDDAEAATIAAQSADWETVNAIIGGRFD